MDQELDNKDAGDEVGEELEYKLVALLCECQQHPLTAVEEWIGAESAWSKLETH